MYRFKKSNNILSSNYGTTQAKKLRRLKDIWAIEGYSDTFANIIVNEFYNTESFQTIPKSAELICVPSTTQQNILPQLFAQKLSINFNLNIFNVKCHVQAYKQSKNKYSFFEKINDPVSFILDRNINLQNKVFIVVDDIINTGETCNTFKRVLIEAGATILTTVALVNVCVERTTRADIELLTTLLCNVLTHTNKETVTNTLNAFLINTSRELFYECYKTALSKPHLFYRTLKLFRYKNKNAVSQNVTSTEFIKLNTHVFNEKLQVLQTTQFNYLKKTRIQLHSIANSIMLNLLKPYKHNNLKVLVSTLRYICKIAAKQQPHLYHKVCFEEYITTLLNGYIHAFMNK